jgi:hypothetical protein
MVMKLDTTLAVLGLLLVTGCGGGSSTKKVRVPVDPPEPAFAAVQFVAGVDNAYFPLVPGTRRVYEGETDEGLERVEEFVSHVPETIAGVQCVVVVVREYLDGELTEETFDWYAQDTEGNVWYLGEDAREYEEGQLVGTDGSWEAGKDGAEAGILMKAILQIGDTYRQEFHPGEAEDMGEIFGLDVVVSLENGVAYTCLQTRDWNPLEPEGGDEFKYYAPGVGMVAEEKADGSELMELVGLSVDTSPSIDPADFLPFVDNPFFPLVPGTVRTYSGATDEGTETVVETVLSQTRKVMGIDCVVVHVLEYVDGELVEETFDWYAQDVDGNVWYMGEDSKEYEEGVVVSTDGSWEAGVDGAQPGIIMNAVPRPGDDYRQEFYLGEAEDMAQVVELEVPVTLSDGSMHVCLKTREWTRLEPDSGEDKYYAPGIGLVLETELDGANPIELIGITP